MSETKHSKTQQNQSLDSSKKKLLTLSGELNSLNSSKLEINTKIEFLQNNLSEINLELQELSLKKNNILKDLHTYRTNASILENRGLELLAEIEKINNSNPSSDNKPLAQLSKTTQRGSFLQRMDLSISWDELKALVEPKYIKFKKNTSTPELSELIRIYLVRHWFSLNLQNLEETLNDSLSMRNFVSMSPGSSAVVSQPLIESFIHFLDSTDLGKSVIDQVNAQLRLRGLKVTNGNVIDAALGAESTLLVQDTSSKNSTKVNNTSGANVSNSITATTTSSLQPQNSNVTPSKSITTRKNKLSFLDYLITYGDPKKLTADIITEFHALVVEKKETRHYLFNANIDNLISDQINFMSYVFPKERISHTNPIIQTAPPNMRVSIGTFDEIANILTYLLIDHFKMERITAPTAAAHILELVEETRCQIEDTNLTVWKPIELRASLINQFFSKKGFICRTISPTEITVLGGFEFPLNILIEPSSKSIILKAVCKANDWASIDDVSTLKETLNSKINSLSFEVNLLDQKPVLTTQYYLPYVKGVPNRLLHKVCQSFTNAIFKGLSIDDNDLIVKPSA